MDSHLLIFIISLLFMQLASAANPKKNVLFLAVDDMRPELGCYLGQDFPTPVHPKIYSPNIDKLASKSLLLKRAYVQQAVCSPSRTSLLTGRRPDTTHVYDLVKYFRKVGGNFTTIPEYFKQNGYESIGMGKIFHPGSASDYDDPPSWTQPYYHSTTEDYWDSKNVSHLAVPSQLYNKKPLPDMQIANHAVNTLKDVSKKALSGEKPFFVAVGFHKPHLPFVIAEEFLDFYPESDIKIPDNGFAPVNMPDIAWSSYGELREYDDIHAKHFSGNINSTLPDNLVRDLRRYYYAALTYTDSLIGRVLKELDDLGLSNNTVVSFWGDHGWQLGEHGEWCKHTNFEIATHAPMMVHIPGMTDKGIVTEKLTEFVDLFPTLVDAAGLPAMQRCPENSSAVKLCTEGNSLMPLISNPELPSWKTKVFSQYPRGGNVMGYSMRTDQYRYTEWVEFTGKPLYQPKWNVSHGTELYDHMRDPEENWNRADDPEYREIRLNLSTQLHSGWRTAGGRPDYPTVNFAGMNSSNTAKAIAVLVAIAVVAYRFASVRNLFRNASKKSNINVLLIIADDLRPELGYYSSTDKQYHRRIKTPNINKLAAKSLVLKRAYVQQALCSPSRTSFLTSRRPDTNHVYDLEKYFRNVGGDFTTIPQYFKHHGYTSIGIGKIFHGGSASGFNDDRISWSEPNFQAPNEKYWNVKNISHQAVSRAMVAERPLPDMQIAEYAIDTLHRLSSADEPFFLAVGFHKPHLPFTVPEEFLKLYPTSDVLLPSNRKAPVDMPTVAWAYYGELRQYKDIGLTKYSGKINTSLPVDLIRELRRHYYASVSYVDSLVGKVLQKLVDLNLATKTVVAFLGDHGWQLGEHGEWCKHTNFEIATHAPMMVHIPGMTDKGMVTEKLTEFVDLFPTLVDAASLPPLSKCPEISSKEKVCTEGDSLVELIVNAKSPTWKSRVFSQHIRGGSGPLPSAMGYSMKTEQYRYTEWVHFTGPPWYQPIWNITYGTELYDHKNDPEENRNKADDSDYRKVRLLLSAQLHSGWRKSRSYIKPYEKFVATTVKPDYDLFHASKEDKLL